MLTQPVHRFGLSGFLTLLVAIASLAPSVASARQDAAGASDHPLIARYDGSVIIAHHSSAFDEFDIAAGPHTSFSPTLTERQTVEGAWTRLLYVAPEGRSTLDVLRNYTATLSAQGFETIFTCRGRECGMGPDPARAGSAIITSALLPRQAMRQTSRAVQYAFTQPHDVRFLSARLDRPEGAVYVSLAIAIEAFDQFRLTANRALVLLDVVETAELEERMVRLEPPARPAIPPGGAAQPVTDFGTFTPPEIPDLPSLPPRSVTLPETPSPQDVSDLVYSPEMEAMRREAEEQLDAVLRARARPDPIIANLTPEDRDQVMALIELVNDFAAEVADRRARFNAHWFHPGRQSRVLEEAFAAEGAQRLFRQVALDNLPTASRSETGPAVHIPQAVYGALRRGDFLNLKQEVVHCFENMVPHQVAAHTIEACAQYWLTGHPGVRPENCLFHPNNEFNDRNDIICHTLDEPYDWVLSSYAERDWFEDKLDQRVRGEEGEEVHPGELTRHLGVQNAVYAPYTAILEALSRAVGRHESSISIFTIGLRTHGDFRRFSDEDPDFLAAHLNEDNEYVLHPAMREALETIHGYMTEARESWRTYETAIFQEFPVLMATRAARRDAYTQTLGRLQEPLYAQLLETWTATPRVHFSPPVTPVVLQEGLRDAQRQSQIQYAAFVNRNTRALAEIERLRNCIRAFDQPANDGRLEWDRRIFHNPLFLFADIAGALEPHPELITLPAPEGDLAGGLAVARPATGLHDMPAWGGLRLAECGLVAGPPEDSGNLEISGADAPEDPMPLLRLAIAVFPDEPDRPTVDEDGLGPELTEPQYEPVGGIHYGHPVYVEVVFETAQPLETYRVTIETASARTEVIVERSKDNPLLYRSGPVVFAHTDGRSAERVQ